MAVEEPAYKLTLREDAFKLRIYPALVRFTRFTRFARGNAYLTLLHKAITRLSEAGDIKLKKSLPCRANVQRHCLRITRAKRVDVYTAAPCVAGENG